MRSLPFTNPLKTILSVIFYVSLLGSQAWADSEIERHLTELDAYKTARYVVIFNNIRDYREGFSFVPKKKIAGVYPPYFEASDGSIVVLLKDNEELPAGRYGRWVSGVYDKSLLDRSGTASLLPAVSTLLLSKKR